jgi:hypothetical protein
MIDVPCTGARNVRLCLAAIAIVSTLGLRSARAYGQDVLSSTFAIDDADPEGSVPSPEQSLRQPLQMGYFVMLLTEKADAATQRGEHLTAARYLRALAKAVPDRSAAFSKMCRAYEAAGDNANALASCKEALGKGGVTLDDYLHFVQLTLSQAGALSRSEVDDVDAVIDHLEQHLDPAQKDSARLVTANLRCELAMRLQDVKRLQACTKTLAVLAPKDPKTQVFAWTLALATHDFARAQRIASLAAAAGVPRATVEGMTRALQVERDRLQPWRPMLRRYWPLGFLVLALLARAAIALARGRRRLRGGGTALRAQDTRS